MEGRAEEYGALLEDFSALEQAFCQAREGMTALWSVPMDKLMDVTVLVVPADARLQL